MPASKKQRSPINKDIETQVLHACRRRCCLCYFLEDNKTLRKGQIAHLNHDPSNSAFSNLVYLCLDHHDDFDSRRSQSKNYTVQEVQVYRDKLYEALNNKNIDIKDNIEELEHLDDETELKFQDLHNRRSYLDEPWKFKMPIEKNPELFAFKSANLFDGICRIERITIDDSQVVIICEQVDGNPGVSVTNAVEDIAFQVCEQFEIDPRKLVWIEHYEATFNDEQAWDMVIFEKMPPDFYFENPKWLRMTDERWQELGFRPRKVSRKRWATLRNRWVKC